MFTVGAVPEALKPVSEKGEQYVVVDTPATHVRLPIFPADIGPPVRYTSMRTKEACKACCAKALVGLMVAGLPLVSGLVQAEGEFAPALATRPPLPSTPTSS